MEYFDRWIHCDSIGDALNKINDECYKLFKGTVTNLMWCGGLSSFAIAISDLLICWEVIVSWQLFEDGLSFIYVL